MQPESLEERCFFCAEILQDIAESAGKAAKHGLNTVDKTEETDETAEATPDALD